MKRRGDACPLPVRVVQHPQSHLFQVVLVRRANVRSEDLPAVGQGVRNAPIAGGRVA